MCNIPIGHDVIIPIDSLNQGITPTVAVHAGRNAVQWCIDNGYSNIYDLDIKYDKAVACFLSFYTMPQVIHAALCINLASPIEYKRLGSIQLMNATCKFATAIGAKGVVVHPGSYIEGTYADGVERLKSSLLRIHKQNPGVKIYLENMVGCGTQLFSSIKQLYDLVKDKDWLGICFDTAHWWLAGHMTQVNIEKLKDVKSKIEVVHLNTTINGFKSKLDRHAMYHFGQNRSLDAHLNMIISNNILDQSIWILERANDDLYKNDIKYLDRTHSLYIA